jgi:hypothetical protein
MIDPVTQTLIVAILRNIARYLSRPDMPNLQGQIYSRELSDIANALEKDLST